MSLDSAEDDSTDGLEGFRRYRSTRDRSLRNELIEEHIGFAYHLADGYADRGMDRADLRQVAIIGLVKSVERFDPDRGVAFATFARPYILGEIRHLFRDTGWEVHVPRSIKDISQRVRQAIEEIRVARGREPTVQEIADEAGATVDDVLAAMDAVRVTRTQRFEAASSVRAADKLLPRSVDKGFRDVERRDLLQSLLSELDDRDQLIIHARFVDELTQSDIAEMVGVSQVHVSRILRKTIAQLQLRLADEGWAADDL